MLPDNSVDAVVTDPPYGLSFMGKKWDYDVPGEAIWRECLRVLKPGGHLLAFAGTRTQHRMAVRIEDAGFEIRDMIAWVYGSGFPKSLDVSKAIDKQDASEEQERRRLRFTAWVRSTGVTSRQIDEATGTNMGGHYTTAASQPAIMTREHLEQCRHLLGDVPEWVEREADIRSVESRNMAKREVLGRSENGIAGGTGKHAGQDAAYGFAGEFNITAPATEAARQWQGWGTALKPALEPITVARKPLVGTVAENVLAHGTGAINVDGCRVGTETHIIRGGGGGEGTGWDKKHEINAERTGRFPANLIHDGGDEVVAGFPAQAGAASPVRGTEASAASVGAITGERDRVPGAFHADTGSAARFFYCARQDVSTPEVGYNEAWQDQNQNQSSALTVGQSLSLLKAVGDIVQKAVATWQSLEGILSNAQSGAFTSVTQSELKTINEVVTATIASIGSGFLPAQQLEKPTPCGSHVKCAAMKEPTGITTITTSLCKSDGCAAVVTSSITQTNLERGVAASRFNYCAKASKRDRDDGCEGLDERPSQKMGDGLKSMVGHPSGNNGNTSTQDRKSRNHHPTVKPTDLMRYLCRLVTPPGGTVLDPFMGSGSTGKAAALEGFHFIGMERDADYFTIAQARIDHARKAD